MQLYKYYERLQVFDSSLLILWDHMLIYLLGIQLNWPPAAQPIPIRIHLPSSMEIMQVKILNWSQRTWQIRVFIDCVIKSISFNNDHSVIIQSFNLIDSNYWVHYSVIFHLINKLMVFLSYWCHRSLSNNN